jgi:hypothetical protein
VDAMECTREHEVLIGVELLKTWRERAVVDQAACIGSLVTVERYEVGCAMYQLC